MATDGIERLHYYQRQYLGALDFEAQQTYHREMRRRLNLAHHTWGIVTGLELKETQKPGTKAVDIYITPGMAIDGYGREIVLFTPTQLDVSLFQPYRMITRTWIVCLKYYENYSQRPLSGYEQCDVPDQFGRVQENYRIVLANPDPFRDELCVAGNAVQAPPLAMDPGVTNPPYPEDQPILPLSPPSATSDLVIPFDESLPYQEFPTDDPATLQFAHWLIPLGKVSWSGTLQSLVQDDSVPPTSPIYVYGRHYVGVVASRLLAPARTLIVRDRNTALPFKASANLKQPAGGAKTPQSSTSTVSVTSTTDTTDVTTGATGTTTTTSTKSTTNATVTTSTPQANTNAPQANPTTPQANAGTSQAAANTLPDGVTMIIEGTLEVDRLLTAKDSIELDGGALDFRDAGGSSDGKGGTDPLFTISRIDPGVAGGTDLRIQIGKDKDGKNRFVVGTTDTTNNPFWVADNGSAQFAGPLDVKTNLTIEGILDFGTVPREMIKLWASNTQRNTIGIVPDGGGATTSFRSSNAFSWVNDNDQLQMKLDQNGNLFFDAGASTPRTRQMLNLWSTNYGIGVQNSTLYYRSDFDFCWFKSGSHSNIQSDPGGGALQMKLDANGGLDVYGSHITFNLKTDPNYFVSLGQTRSGVHGSNSITGSPDLWLDAAGAVIAKQGFRISPKNGAAFFHTGTTAPQPGEVVVLDNNANNGSVVPSTTPNSHFVVGVAMAPSDPGFILADQPLQQNGTLVALMGIVPCHVDNTTSSTVINVGDLLTSSTNGNAQLATSPIPTGTVLGKAMEVVPAFQQMTINVLIMPG